MITLKSALQHAQQAARGDLKSLETVLRELIGGSIRNTIGVEAGSGIAGIAAVYETQIVPMGDLIATKILLDLTGLNSAATGDIIGDNGEANCHIGRISFAESGTPFSGLMTCLEAPATGDDDIDVYSATESTGAEDAAITGLTETALLASGGAWTAGQQKAMTALPADLEYLYLTSGGAGASATYTAGKFLIEFLGLPA